MENNLKMNNERINMKERIKDPVLIAFFIMVTILTSIMFINADLSFEPEQPADLIISCFGADKSFCSASATCNITVLSPNMTVFVNNQVMTNSGTYFNYTTPSLNNRGEYNTVVKCNEGSDEGYVAFTFISTSFPITANESQGSIAIGVLFSLLAIAILFMILGFKIARTQYYPVAVFLIVMSFILILVVLHLGYTYNRDILISSTGSELQLRVYLILMYSGMFGVFLGVGFFLMKLINNLKAEKDKVNYGDGYNHDANEYD